MAINKVETIANDMVVIFLSGSWYGIPFGQLVQTDAIVDRYGLEVSKITLQDDDVAVNTCDPKPEQILKDKVILLRNKFRDMGGDHLQEVKALIVRFPSQFTAILNSCLIP